MIYIFIDKIKISPNSLYIQTQKKKRKISVKHLHINTILFIVTYSIAKHCSIKFCKISENRNNIEELLEKELVLFLLDFLLFLIFMSKITDFVNSAISNYRIDSSKIQNVQVCVNEEMKVDGWISLILSDRECVVLKFNNEVFMNEGYVLNDEKVLKVFGNEKIGDISYNEESIVEEGIVDLDSGSRFEGRLLIEGKMGIPFGFGEMYDDDGKLMYKGIMINWKRFGYGVNYHDNGEKEYEGYWCNDNRFGKGKVYDRYGNLVKECVWHNGNEIDIDYYEGDGNKPINIGIKYLKLSNNCLLKNWDVSWFYNLEIIEIGNECFESVKTFKIDGLNQLKTLKIGKNSFTEVKNASTWDDSAAKQANEQTKSFHILNCELLESIEIGECSFCDFAGQFELRNLPALQSIQIGEISEVANYFSSFLHNSFVIRGIIMTSIIECVDLPNLLSITLGDHVFDWSLSTIIESIV